MARQETGSWEEGHRSGTKRDLSGLWASQIWLIRLRWLAILGVLVTVLITFRHDLLPDPAPALLLVGGLASFNLALWIWVRMSPETRVRTRRQLEWGITLVIHLDLFTLTLLLHVTGGIENPFALFYVFHTAIAATLLSSSRAVLIGISACLMYGGLVLGEFWEVFEHHPLSVLEPGLGPSEVFPLWASPFFVFGKFLALCMALAGVIYFVQAVVKQQRQTEHLRRRQEKAAMSWERLARIGEISAGLAHSIRNPLHGLLNCLDLLKADPDQAASKETLELMAEGLRRIEGVTNRLLVLTREAPLRFALTRPNEVVADTIQFIESQLQDQGIELENEVLELPEIPLDADRFHEALFNIIDNAVDACREKAGGLITIRTFPIKDPFSGACVEVEDTGIGIDSTGLEHIFDPFYTTKAIGEGSGLGLAIANRVIKQHGGTIEVKSVPGHGTTVRILLPLESPEAPERQNAS